MSLLSRIEEDFKQAMTRREADKVSCLRMIKAAIKNKEIDLRGKLDDSQIVALLKTQAKQRKESIEQFEKGGRPELAAKEKSELTLIEAYLPQQMAEAEIAKLLDQAVQETGAQGAKDMGKVMKALMPKLGGRADGKLVNELVKKKLG